MRQREEAKAEFEKAIFEGRSAALLEQDRDDTFTQRLGSLPAGRSVEITIEVLHPLAFLVADGDDAPQWEYRFPTVVGVRFQGADGRVPDADRLNVDRAGTGGSIPTRVPRVEFARDLTILIDASGSMSGAPIEWAKDVAAELLRTLAATDRFELIAFASQPRPLTPGLVPVNVDSLCAALGGLTALRAGGGTEVVDAVIEALKPLRPESQHQVVLITDGEIGFEDQVVTRIVERAARRCAASHGRRRRS